MSNNEFEQLCKKTVANYYNENVEKTDNFKITEENVFIVWSCKTLQNNKAMISTSVSDGMYYELTFNGNKKELYFDAYKKWENKLIKIEGENINE